MKFVLWIILLFIGASGASLYLSAYEGTLQLSTRSHIITTSVNFAVIVLILVFLLLHLALRAISAMSSLPKAARAHRQQHIYALASGAMAQSYILIKAGRHVRAATLLQDTLKQVDKHASDHPAEQKTQGLPALQTGLRVLLLECLNEAKKTNERDQALQQLQQDAPAAARAMDELPTAITLLQAQWDLEDHAPTAALKKLEQMDANARRRIASLRLKFNARLALQHYDKAMAVARILKSHLPASAAQSSAALIQSLAISQLQATSTASALEAFFDSLPPAEKQSPELFIAFARQWQSLAPGQRMAASVSEPVWAVFRQDPLAFEEQHGHETTQHFAHHIGQTLLEQPQQRLAEIEALHTRLPGNSHVAYIFGLACYRLELWGKAEHLFQTAAKAQNPAFIRKNILVFLGLLAERKGQKDEASNAWRLAAQM